MLNMSNLMIASLLLAGCQGGGQDGEIAEVDTSECAAGLKWIGGNEESPLMHPGRDCVSCHQAEGEGPLFGVAGTVHQNAHESDDCFGVEDVLVEITDANGTVLTTTTNQAGNFYLDEQLVTPLSARIEYEGREASMLMAQPTGRCASCHSEQGLSGAPGRIIAP